MNADNLVSVIIPVYNVEAYLRRCVNSVVCQTYKTLEIILVDDGSTDSSAEICDSLCELDERIQVIHKKNGGLSDARNAGLACAHGAYVSFVDSDDYVHPQFIEVLLNAMNAAKAGIGKCGILAVHDEIPVFPALVESSIQNYNAEQYMEQINRVNNGFSVCNKLFEKKLFDVFRFSVGKLHEDVDAIYKLVAMSGKVTEVKDNLYYYYANPESITKRKIDTRRLDDLEFRMDLYTFCRKRGWMTAARKNADELYRAFLRYQNVPDQEIRDVKNYRRRISALRWMYIKHVLFAEKYDLRESISLLLNVLKGNKGNSL